ncbi:uncharacterized protein At2g39795, mitochondrial isoform X2 [Dendrobium catenatum]|nr:uncharacterized protein At2g39795, mitochondrial isoform X2 [Dendrobium catenatum]XP_028552372.1 uncharacterized protein At2g39795, mitochondrial isoform X2 [Dendrobium catenatum]
MVASARLPVRACEVGSPAAHRNWAQFKIQYAWPKFQNLRSLNPSGERQRAASILPSLILLQAAMTFSITLRRVTGVAARAAQGFCFQNRRSYHLAFLPPLLQKGILSRVESRELLTSFSLARFSSSIQKKPAADVELLRIVESEIGCAKDECAEVGEVPEGFPFEIQDEEGTNVITLRRDYHGENIEVVVSMPTVEDTEDDEEGVDEENQGEDEKNDQPTIPLTVNISKGDGSTLEFCCTAYADELVIDSLCIRGNKVSDDLLAYEGPDFSDLDENLQKAFHNYLEIRGISTETTNFLYKYLISKDDREYLTWLQNVKYFLEKQ